MPTDRDEVKMLRFLELFEGVRHGPMVVELPTARSSR